jgi:hypothetical protein
MPGWRRSLDKSYIRPRSRTTRLTADVLLTVPVVQPGWYSTGVTFTIELEREDDGRWVVELPALPGVFATAATTMRPWRECRHSHSE